MYSVLNEIWAFAVVQKNIPTATQKIVIILMVFNSSIMEREAESTASRHLIGMYLRI